LSTVAEAGLKSSNDKILLGANSMARLASAAG
jgi:hypothetical protein